MRLGDLAQAAGLKRLAKRSPPSSMRPINHGNLGHSGAEPMSGLHPISKEGPLDYRE